MFRVSSPSLRVENTENGVLKVFNEYNQVMCVATVSSVANIIEVTSISSTTDDVFVTLLDYIERSFSLFSDDQRVLSVIQPTVSVVAGLYDNELLRRGYERNKPILTTHGEYYRKRYYASSNGFKVTVNVVPE